MAAHLAAGKIGGLPFKGGIVSLNAADTTAVINATTGLIREAAPLVGGAIGLGFFGLLLSALLQPQKTQYTGPDHRKPYNRVESDLRYARSIMSTRSILQHFHAHQVGTGRIRSFMDSEPRVDEFHPLSGICAVTTKNHQFLGICLDQNVSFGWSGHRQEARLVDLVAIARGHYSDSKVGLVLRDGSTFEDISFPSRIRFATLVGEVSVDHAEDIEWIRGITPQEAGELRHSLPARLTQLELLKEQVGLDLVRKYFDIVPLDAVAPTPGAAAAPTYTPTVFAERPAYAPKTFTPMAAPPPAQETIVSVPDEATGKMSLAGKLMAAAIVGAFMMVGALGGALLHFFA